MIFKKINYVKIIIIKRLVLLARTIAIVGKTLNKSGSVKLQVLKGFSNYTTLIEPHSFKINSSTLVNFYTKYISIS